MENQNNTLQRRDNIKKEGRSLFLFDVDATLTPARNPIEENMIEFLKGIRKHYDIAAVGGSDLVKLKEQLGGSISLFKYVFTENGLVSFKDGEKFHEKKINDYLGEDKLKRFLKFCLRYIAELDIPIQRGTFIEYRTGLINISPMGRNCSQKERNEFAEFNKTAKILESFKETLEKEFVDFNMNFAIGGQISFDCYPKGWDKTYCLQFLEEYDNIFFYGDKTHKGGNDHEISIDSRVTSSFTVTGPADTKIKVILAIKEIHSNFSELEKENIFN